MRTRVFVLAIVVSGCTHDYDALMNPSGTGGRGGTGGNTAAGGRGGTGGDGSGGSTVTGTAGTTGNAGTTGIAGTTGVGGVGNTMGVAGRGGTTGTGNTAGGGTTGTGNTGGSTSCPSGQAQCSDGACVPPNGGDALHCGGCSPCPSAAVCNSGTCVCSIAGQMLCSNACVDTRTSNTHCGGCNRPCAGTCMNGTCIVGTTCSTAFEVAADGYVRAPGAAGACWHGYAFAGGDTGSTIAPTTFSACGMPCMLRMSGTVGPATMANNYSGVAYLGFNLGQSAGTTTALLVTPTGTGLTVAFAASTGTLPLRVQLTGGGSTFWCYNVTGASPVTIPYAMFNTACWDNSGTAYGKQPIQAIELVVPGGAAATSLSVTLTSVKEN